MSNELATTTSQVPAWMNPENLNQALDLAKQMANSGLLPDHLNGNPGGVLMIMDQAQRWGLAPLAVAQGTSVVHGRLCYEGKLIHAALISLGGIREPLEFEYKGEERTEGRKIIVKGVLKSGQLKTITGTVADWKTVSKSKKTGANVSPWQPGNYDKMLAYRGAREWARMHAPTIISGVTTPDEAEEIKEAEGVKVHGEPMPATTGDTKAEALEPVKEEAPEPEQKQEPAQAETPEHIVDARNLYLQIQNRHPASAKKAIDELCEMYNARVPGEIAGDNITKFHGLVRICLQHLEKGGDVAGLTKIIDGGKK